MTLTQYRENWGWCFQSFNLFENLNVLEKTIVAQTTVLNANVQKLKRLPRKPRKVGMENATGKPKPETTLRWSKTTCSHRSRLSMNLDAILFDEPTSALDPEMVGEVPQNHEDLAPRRLDYDCRNSRNGIRP